MMKLMRYAAIVAVVANVACGHAPNAPERVYTANLLASDAEAFDCREFRCSYELTVANEGPDCADQISVSSMVTTGTGAQAIRMAVGLSVPGMLAPNQRIGVRGFDYPRSAYDKVTTATGRAIACR